MLHNQIFKTIDESRNGTVNLFTPFGGGSTFLDFFVFLTSN